jgi:predicted alpha/beta superfamily hydrolase
VEPTQPIVIEKAVRVDFRSAVNQRRYSISVALPLVAAREKGYRVLYVLDGYWYFASAMEAVRKNAPDVVVVGISYPDDPAYIQSVLERHPSLPVWFKSEPAFRSVVFLERFYDLTLPASDAVLTSDLRSYGITLGVRDVGGLNDFLKVLETEIKPRVVAMAPIDSSNQTIFGHSLGGLAVLHALFVAPGAFRTFIAASPSIWWSEEAVLRGEAKFADAVRAGTTKPRVLVTVGSEEQTADPKVAAQFLLDSAEFAAQVRRNRMVDNALELTERLNALPASGDFKVEYAVFPAQSHGIAPWPALGRAVSFAFRSN